MNCAMAVSETVLSAFFTSPPTLCTVGTAAATTLRSNALGK
jgi:hypothetical protein